MSSADEPRGDDPLLASDLAVPSEHRGDDPMQASDLAVPIVDIPPCEDLALSNGILEAVATMEDEEKLVSEKIAAEATGSAVDNPIEIPDDIITAPISAEDVAPVSAAETNGVETMSVDIQTVVVEEIRVTVDSETELSNAIEEIENSPMEAPAFVETSIETTSFIVADEGALEVPTDVLMAPIATPDPTILSKREKSEDGTLGPTGDEGESGPLAKKLKAEVDGHEPEAVAAVPATETVSKDMEVDQGKPVQLGPKTFLSGVDMFKYFYDLLHAWISNHDVNKYEFLVLSELITKGHRDAEAKIGSGIKSFQVRFHPGWHSRCYYLIRTDGSVDDFSYRKCVDKLMPLPESLFSPSGDLLVDKLFGPEEDKWGKKRNERFQGGHNTRGTSGGRGGRRSGGRGRY